MKLHTRILLGLGAGILVGAASKVGGAEYLQRAIVAVEPLGTAFIRLVTMVRQECEKAGIGWAIWEDPVNMNLFDSLAGTWLRKWPSRASFT